MSKSYWFIVFIASFSCRAYSNDLSNLIQYGAGYYGSIYIHEFGHAVAAKYYGASDIEIQVAQKGNYFGGVTHYKNSIENSTPFTNRVESLAGLLAGNLAGEIVIQKEGLHSNPFAQSIASTAQVTNLANVYNYYTRHRGENGWEGNDIDQFELSGGNPHLLSAILAGYTIWSLKRMGEKHIPLYGFEYKF